MTLPPLPPLPATRYCIGIEGSEYEEDRLMHSWSAWDDEAIEKYARVYAEQAVADERARVLGWLDDALADHGLCWPGEIDTVREQIASGRARGPGPQARSHAPRICASDQQTALVNRLSTRHTRGMREP